MGCATSSRGGNRTVVSTPRASGVGSSVYEVSSPGTVHDSHTCVSGRVHGVVKAGSISSTSNDGSTSDPLRVGPKWAPSDVSSASMAQDDESALPPLRLRNSRERGGTSKGSMTGTNASAAGDGGSAGPGAAPGGSARTRRPRGVVGGSGAPAFLSRSGTHSPKGSGRKAELAGASFTPSAAAAHSSAHSSRSVNRGSGSVKPRVRGGKTSPPLSQVAGVDRAPLGAVARSLPRVFSLEDNVAAAAAERNGGGRLPRVMVGGSARRHAGSGRGAKAQRGLRTVSGPVTIGGGASSGSPGEGRLAGAHVGGSSRRSPQVTVDEAASDAVPSPLSSARSTASSKHFTSNRSLRFDGDDDGSVSGDAASAGSGGGVQAATRVGIMSQHDERDARLRLARPPLRVLVEGSGGSSFSASSSTGTPATAPAPPGALARLVSSGSGGSSDDELITSGRPGMRLGRTQDLAGTSGAHGSQRGGGSGLSGLQRPPPLGLSGHGGGDDTTGSVGGGSAQQAPTGGGGLARGLSMRLGSGVRPAGLYIDAASSHVSDAGPPSNVSAGSPREFTVPTLVTPSNDEDVFRTGGSAVGGGGAPALSLGGPRKGKRASPAPSLDTGVGSGGGLGGASRFGGGFAGLRVHSGAVPCVNTTFSDDEEEANPPRLTLDTAGTGRGGTGSAGADGSTRSAPPGLSDVLVPDRVAGASSATPSGRRSASEGPRRTTLPNGIAAHAARRGSGGARALHAKSPSPVPGLRQSVGGMGLALNCGSTSGGGGGGGAVKGRPPTLRLSASMPVPTPFLGDLFQMPLGVSPRIHSRSPQLGASPRVFGGATLFKSQSLGTKRAPTVVSVPTQARELATAAHNYRRLHGEFDAIALLPAAGEVSPSFRMSTQNRHSMFPFSHSVVRLTSDRYINASHIHFPKWPQRRYIAAMGPLPKTVGPFWTAVWEQDVSVVAMLTKEKEGRRNKCHRYWPELGAPPLAPADAGVTVEAVHSVELGVIQCGGDAAAVAAAAAYDASLSACGADVWKDHDDTSPADVGSVAWATSGMNTPSARPADDVPPEAAGVGIIARHFVLRHVAGDDAAPGPARVVTQLQCVSWPDGAVPSSTANTMALRRLAVSRHALPPPASVPGTPESRPLMAHCSAGVGRTGTFIVSDRLLCELESVAATEGRTAVMETEVDIAAEVCAMRQGRTCMCYTPEQYAFVYRMVADAVHNLATYGVTEGPSAPPTAVAVDAALGGAPPGASRCAGGVGFSGGDGGSKTGGAGGDSGSAATADAGDAAGASADGEAAA